MAARFSVVQYVPDPIANERVNIGIIALGENEAHCKFLENWDRVRMFAGSDVDFLKEFASSVDASLCKPGQRELGTGVNSLDLTTLERMTESWTNTIQFTPLRGSILDPGNLVERISRDYLVEPEEEVTPLAVDEAVAAHKSRTKTQVTSATECAIAMALENRFRSPKARNLVAREVEYPGRNDTHSFDVAVRNGDIYLGIFTLSFGSSRPNYLENQIKIAGWNLADVRAGNDRVRLALVASPPEGVGKDGAKYDSLYQRTERICNEYEALLVPESDLDNLALNTVGALPDSAFPAQLAL